MTIMKQKEWGRSASIDLHGVDHDLIRDPKMIRSFVVKLCKLIKMHRVGSPLIKRFGHKKLRGYSMMQFIKTSCITAHFDEVGNRAFIDVFSCKNFEPKVAVKFCKEFFKAKEYKEHEEKRR